MKSTLYTDDHFQQMAKSMQGENDLKEVVNKAIRYIKVLRKEDAEFGSSGYYESDKYWIPPFSKLKVMLAYVASVRNEALPVLVEFEKLYGVARTVDDVLGSSIFNNAESLINKLHSEIEKCA